MPPRKRKRRPRHHRVTTVPSTGNFLAPRSARRSDASQTQPGGRRAEACGAKGSLAGCGARLRRVQRPAAHAQPGRHRLTSLRAPRVARTPQTQPGSRRAEAGSGAKQRRLAPRSARRSDARFGSPRSALRASLGRLKRSRAVGGRKLAAVPSNGASLRAPRVARTLASAHLAPRSARRSDASNAAGQSASESLRRHRPPARLRRPRVQTQPGRGRSRRSLRRAHTRARFRARTIVRGHDAPALPRQTACGAHLGPRPPKQLVWRARTPPRMGERAPSRRALDQPHQPAARPDRPSARPASRPPRLALERRPAYGRENPARSHGNPMTRAQR